MYLHTYTCVCECITVYRGRKFLYRSFQATKSIIEVHIMIDRVKMHGSNRYILKMTEMALPWSSQSCKVSIRCKACR